MTQTLQHDQHVVRSAPGPRDQEGKATVWIILLILLLAAAGAWYYFTSGLLRINVTEAEILERLEEKLPITKTYLYVFKVTFESPRIDLQADSKRINAGLDLALEITLLNDPNPLRGSVDASAGVRYSRQDAAFYLEDPEIVDLHLDNLEPGLVERTRGVLEQAIGSYFESQPIYRLTERQSHAAAKAVLREVEISDDRLTLHLGPEEPGDRRLPASGT